MIGLLKSLILDSIAEDNPKTKQLTCHQKKDSHALVGKDVLELSGQPSPNADPIIPPACIAMTDKSNKFLTAFHCLQQDERVNIQSDHLC